jgi:hypothetical protein
MYDKCMSDNLSRSFQRRGHNDAQLIFYLPKFSYPTLHMYVCMYSSTEYGDIVCNQSERLQKMNQNQIKSYP